MLTLDEFEKLLFRLWETRLQKAEEVDPSQRPHFYPGYTNAIADLCHRFGVGKHEFHITSQPDPSGTVEMNSIASALAWLRADRDRFEEKERRERPEGHLGNFEGFCIGYRRALNDVARELGLGEG